MSDAEHESLGPRRTLSLWDAVSIIVGIVVGVSIFKVPAIVFSNVQSGWAGLGVWLAAGLLCLAGTLCYAELATLHGRGGEYRFLSHAYGPHVGFLFGWAQLTGVFSGSIGAMAYVFADYASQCFGLESSTAVWLAIGAILILTSLHLLGVRSGQAVQNALTFLKIVGLGALLLLGLTSTQGDLVATSTSLPDANVGLVWIVVLYAYGGWNDAAFVAADVKHPERNIPRALAGGMLAITVLYMLVNLAFWRGLGIDLLRSSKTPASTLIEQSAILSESWRVMGSQLIGLLVMTSALGAVHGLLFTGSRLYLAMGADHPMFARLSRWNSIFGSPVWSLLAQAAATCVLILAVGTPGGRESIDAAVGAFGRAPLPWDQYEGGFQTLVSATAPVFWAFFLLNAISLFVFRIREPAAARPFRVPFYPLLPVVFCLTCAFMLYQSLAYARDLTLLALVPLAAGLPIYWLNNYLRWKTRCKNPAR